MRIIIIQPQVYVGNSYLIEHAVTQINRKPSLPGFIEGIMVSQEMVWPAIGFADGIARHLANIVGTITRHFQELRLNPDKSDTA